MGRSGYQSGEGSLVQLGDNFKGCLRSRVRDPTLRRHGLSLLAIFQLPIKETTASLHRPVPKHTAPTTSYANARHEIMNLSIAQSLLP